MELKEFVKQTLLDVFEAVQEAGAEISQNPDRRGAIVPLWGGLEHVSNHEQSIKFDVAVTAAEGTKKQGRGGIRVWGLDFSGKAGAHEQHREVSRVCFRVPVALPSTPVLGSTPEPRKGGRKTK
jgi:hypothetical protein